MHPATAIILGLTIFGFVMADAAFFDWTLSLSWARRFADLLHWMAFWR